GNRPEPFRRAHSANQAVRSVARRAAREPQARYGVQSLGSSFASRVTACRFVPSAPPVYGGRVSFLSIARKGKKRILIQYGRESGSRNLFRCHGRSREETTV